LLKGRKLRSILCIGNLPPKLLQRPLVGRNLRARKRKGQGKMKEREKGKMKEREKGKIKEREEGKKKEKENKKMEKEQNTRKQRKMLNEVYNYLIVGRGKTSGTYL
jgi:hypothetical protein